MSEWDCASAERKPPVPSRLRRAVVSVAFKHDQFERVSRIPEGQDWRVAIASWSQAHRRVLVEYLSGVVAGGKPKATWDRIVSGRAR